MTSDRALAGHVRGLRLGCPDRQRTAYISAVNDILPDPQRLPATLSTHLSGLGDVCVSEPTAIDLSKDPG